MTLLKGRIHIHQVTRTKPYLFGIFLFMAFVCIVSCGHIKTHNTICSGTILYQWKITLMSPPAILKL